MNKAHDRQGSRKKARGLPAKQRARTDANILKRRERHCAKHPKDSWAHEALDTKRRER